MVYIDNMNARFGKMIMCHMIADTTKELLEMADNIGVKRKWIQDAGTYSEHFDVSLGAKKKAIEFGAKQITMREIARMCNMRSNAPAFLKKMQDEIDNQIMTEDNAPVLVVTNKSRKLVHAGQPNTFNKKLLAEYAQKGYSIKTITIKAYRAKTWKWYWEK